MYVALWSVGPKLGCHEVCRMQSVDVARRGLPRKDAEVGWDVEWLVEVIDRRAHGRLERERVEELA